MTPCSGCALPFATHPGSCCTRPHAHVACVECGHFCGSHEYGCGETETQAAERVAYAAWLLERARRDYVATHPEVTT